MRKDLLWFHEYIAQWNGVNLIPDLNYDKELVVDACGTGVGGSDGINAYALAVAHLEDPVKNITQLEALNVVIAIQTFISEADRGRHVLVKCESLASGVSQWLWT